MEHDKEGDRKNKTTEVPTIIMSNEIIEGSKNVALSFSNYFSALTE
jgi:hypothetical protein